MFISKKISIIIALLLIAILFVSCAPAATNVAPTEISVFTPSTTDFTEPDPETWVMLMPAVREYFYYRKQAVIAGNAEVLWKRYPELRDGADIPVGINAEEFFINNMQGLKPFDGNIFPESYEKIQVNYLDEKAEILTHGMELYLYADETGMFEDSGSEFKLIIFLRRQDNQWLVYKTHDISGP